MDQARKFHALLKEANVEYTALSWDGFDIFGDRKSIDECLRLKHAAGTIGAYQKELLEARRLSFDWMKKHDELLGFIQARPAVLKELIDARLSETQNQG